MTRNSYEVGQVVRLSATDEVTGPSLLESEGDLWLITEIDRSILASNLGMLLVPARYQGTDHLDPKYDRSGRIHIVYGTAIWSALEPVRIEEVLAP